MEKFWPILVPKSWKNSGTVWKRRNEPGPPGANEQDTSTHSAMAALALAGQQHLRADPPTLGGLASAYGLRERAVPQSLGVLEQEHRYFHDRGGPLHSKLPFLRRHHRQTTAAGR